MLYLLNLFCDFFLNMKIAEENILSYLLWMASLKIIEYFLQYISAGEVNDKTGHI